MKKLSAHIEDIHIKGGVDQLSDLVSGMDKSLQNLADNSDRFTVYLFKYSGSNKGNQFKKIVETSLSLRDDLYTSAIELNDLQKQIVDYQNKIYRFEDISARAAAPNPFLASRRRISTDSSSVQFTRMDMEELVRLMSSYIGSVRNHLKAIVDNKNSIAAIWLDSQYYAFAEFVDEIARKAEVAIREYEAYIQDLEIKIKELG